MKTLSIDNNEGLVVNYLVDLIGSNDLFTVYDILTVKNGVESVGYTDEVIALNYPFKIGGTYTVKEFEAFANSRTTTLVETSEETPEPVFKVDKRVRIEMLDFTLSSDVFGPGDVITISTNIINRGSRGSQTLTWFLKDENLNILLQGTHSTGEVDRNEEKIVSFDITIPSNEVESYLTEIGVGVGVGKTKSAQSLRSYWKQQIYQDGVTFDKGKVILQFDDAWETVYTNGLPLFTVKGIKVTIWANASLITSHQNYNGTTQMTWAQLAELRSLGHDVQCHGNTGLALAGATDEQRIDEYVNNNIGFVANGFPSPIHTSYSVGSYNAASLKITDNYRKTGRAGTRNNHVDRKSSKFEMPCGALSNTITTIKEQIYYAATENKAIVLYGHMIGYADALSISVADLTEIIDYAQSLDVDFITISQLYELLFYIDIRLSRECANDQIDITVNATLTHGESISLERSNDGGVTYSQIHVFAPGETEYSDTGLTANTNYYYRARGFRGVNYLPYSRVVCISTPMTMVLTATGTGAGVAKLIITTGIDMSVSLDGNGRFYTDAAGTLNESITYNFVKHVVTTVYIRCASGVSNMVFPSNFIIKFEKWESATNAPSLSFDVSILSNTPYIAITGNNTVTGTLKNSLDYGITNTVDFGTSGATVTGVLSGEAYIKRLVINANSNIDLDASKLSWVTYLQLLGGGTVTGDTRGLGRATTIYFGTKTNITYTSFVWAANMVYAYFYTSPGNGWPIADITQAIIDASATTWTSSKLLRINTNQPSMADTNQGGVWGDFSGVASPSALAIAYKNLMVTKGVVVTLTGIAAPGGSGDGTGFPAGFGNWYRS
jgi:peptidoglycan/xylan/chitin deacetylase (PgdA/CDA1 family)